MKPVFLKAGPIALLTVALLLSASAAAQDGTLRERLRERRQVQASEAQAQPAPITAPGDYRYSLEHGGRTRLYRVHVPPGYRSDTPAPLLLSLHGGGGSMDYMARDENYGQLSHAARAGQVLVFPNGISRFRSGMLATWNAGACCGAARDENVDDVGFIRLVLERVMHQLNIDRQRVYATGMSNGAMMAYRLACEIPGLIRGIAAVAGTDNTLSCTPAQPVSVLHIHARNDTHVLYEGGAGPDSVDRAQVTDYRSVPETLVRWVERNRCPRTPQRVLEKDGAWCERYAPCAEGTQVQLCVTDAGGHSWPGGHKRRGEAPTQAVSANELMWAFFGNPPR
ncbi:PHB depolymerase family esterase [Curvibacter sp. PAE-UM]|uniref:extracellular catalytic domain type 1 short-chain-length polyhydroxyalkanoate depolymerase n=1 Tax=Curvibacter sp. PAE-UM TaxID=1714344 RepID=UPI00071005F4|nr:PHB depolymerase family esterase [Curvibacter sp. PAE-UM]KRI01677.1 poly(3-hydroxybutyrate) depolymerase [Curvibacter sp. PAE-UM]